MKPTLTLLLLFQVLWVAASEDWGQTGHRALAQVAERNLSPKARAAVEKLLDGHSMAAVSTYADEIRSNRKYRKYGSWHYVNVPFDKTYAEIEPNPEGDVIQGIEYCVSVLKDPKATKEDKAFYLKLLIHFVGDMHQPLHLGLEEDKGGNDFQLRWFNKGSNLHRVWDSEMINHYQMSYTELADNLPRLSPVEIEAIQQGNVREWAEEVRILTKEVYKSAVIGEKLGYRYMYDHFDTVKRQLLKGGLRLSRILNDIYK